MPRGRREAWREQSPIYNTRGQPWGGRHGSKHNLGRQASAKDDRSWWDVSHRNLWKEFEAEHDNIDREFERFKKQIDADPFGALFGRRLHRLNYQPHTPSLWTSVYHSLFGNTQQPMGSKTIDVGKSGKGTKQQTSSTAKSTDAAKPTSYNSETVSESIPSYSSAADVPLKFDPISGRMVRENTSPSVEPVMADFAESDKGVDIPVKEFKADEAQSSPQIPETSVGETIGSETLGTSSQGGIARPEDIEPSPDSERLAETNTSERYQAKESEDVAQPQSRSAEDDGIFSEGQNGSSQTEPPMWRLWERPSFKSQFGSEEEKLGRKSSGRESFQDLKDEDLDLLRSSDIRASYSSVKEKPSLEAEKPNNRGELEREFDAYQDGEEDIDIETLRSRARGEGTAPQAAAINLEPGSQRERIQKENIDNLADEIQATYEDTSGIINGQQKWPTPENPIIATGHSREVTGGTDAIDSSKDITYSSGKVGAATQTDSQAATPSATTVEKYSSSIYREHVNELLDNIREFKESCGALLDELIQTINRAASSSQMGNSIQSASYKILAYDPSLSRVTDAEVTSSSQSPEETPLSPEDIFSCLNNPAKFLPYLAELDAEGYEAVSASEDVLVLKKVRTVNTADESISVSAASPTASSRQAGQGEKESLGQAQSSPTKPHPDPLLSSSSSSSSSPRMVRRQETVFTGGPPNWSPYPPPSSGDPDFISDTSSSSSKGDDHQKESFLHKTSRRVILTGVATAGTCYALGVVSEYFRTGGQDGKGPDGFTAI